MTHLFRKLKSRSGASMVLALMFMLICVFVGGSVLVAATVNSGRLNGRREAQQAILNQRSIISVLSGELVDDNGKIDLRVSVNKINDTASEVVVPETDGIKKLIYQCAAYTCAYGRPYSMDFEVNYSSGDGTKSETTECTVTCGTDYTVCIGFKKLPQVKLKLSASKTASAISWYEGKIIKDGAE